MKEKFKELLRKKAQEGKFLSDDEKSAKMDILDELQGNMKDIIGDNVKKVTVASDTNEGLQAGLEKAEEVLEKKSEADAAECEMCDEEGYDQELVEPVESKDDRIARLKAELAELEG